MAKQIVMAIQMQARRDNRGMLLIANFQKLLAVVGLPVAVDGIYGPQTAAATRRIAARMNAASLPLEVQVASVISAASRAMTQPGAAPLDPSRMAQPVEPRAAGLPNVPMPGAQAVQTVSIEPKFVQPAPISAQIVPAVKPDIYAGQPDSQTVPAVPGKIYDPRAPQLVDEPKADGGIFGMAHGGGIFGAAGQHVA
jgi:peptidoglycan hydrolase-like protein with peptidoglycan-binding domain